MAVKFLLGLGTARPNVMSLVYSTSRLARLFEGRVRSVNRFHVLSKHKNIQSVEMLPIWQLSQKQNGTCQGSMRHSSPA